MPQLICPKCGFQQESGVECARCGVVFERYNRLYDSNQPIPPSDDTAPAKPQPSRFRRAYRAFVWLSLVGFIVSIVLILWPSSPPRIDSDPAAAQSATLKVEQFRESGGTGRPHTLQLREGELNAWLGSNLALAPASKTEQPAVVKPAPGQDPTLEEVRSTVRDVKIALLGDGLSAYVLFDLYGKDMSLTLDGRLVMENGYLRLQPTGGKLGSMPLPQGTLDAAVRRLFESPENKEQFRLPPDVTDIRIQNSELIITRRQ